MNTGIGTQPAGEAGPGREGMLGRLAGLVDGLAETLPCGEIPALSDDDTVAAVAEVERLGRRVDALRVTLAGEVADRSRPSRGLRGLAASRGCRTPGERLERLTQVAGATARRRIVLAGDLRRDPFPGGDRTRARFDRVAGAVEDGTLGVDAASAVTRGLTPLLAHASLDELAAAETDLVAAATGTAPDGTAPDSTVPYGAVPGGG